MCRFQPLVFQGVNGMVVCVVWIIVRPHDSTIFWESTSVRLVVGPNNIPESKQAGSLSNDAMQIISIELIDISNLMILNWLIYLYYIWFSLFMSASCFDSILLIWRHTSGQITIVPTPEFKVILRGWFPPPSYSDQPVGMGRPHPFTVRRRNPGVVVHHHRILPKESDVSSPIQRVNATATPCFIARLSWATDTKPSHDINHELVQLPRSL